MGKRDWISDFDRAKNIISVTARAPCSTANLGPGFDMFGLALDAFYDEVTVTKKPESFGMKIVSSDDIPLDPKKNTAGIVAKEMLDPEEDPEYGLPGMEIKIKKNVPPGYGMGSSAASAAACAVAVNRLYGMHWGLPELTWFAGVGEKASAGVMHFDNVAASLGGGFVVVGSEEEARLGRIGVGRVPLHYLEPPKDLRVVIAVPKIKVPKQKTKISREVIPKNVKFSDALTNQRNAIRIALGFAKGDGHAPWQIGYYASDIIVEPARKKMIPGYDVVKKNAMRTGANGVTISGAGPSVIAFTEEGPTDNFDGPITLKDIGAAMKKGFKSAKVDCDIVICKPSKGARVIKLVK
jgi:homoserine kinase